MAIVAMTTMTRSANKAILSCDVIGGFPQFGHLPAFVARPHPGHEIRIVNTSPIAVSASTPACQIRP